MTERRERFDGVSRRRVLQTGAITVGTLGVITPTTTADKGVISQTADVFGQGPDGPVVASGLGFVLFVLGVPSAWDTDWLGWFDAISVDLFLPLTVFLVVFFVGWIVARDAVDEIRQGAEGLPDLSTLWLWSARTVVLLAVLGTLALGVLELATPADAYIIPPI